MCGVVEGVVVVYTRAFALRSARGVPSKGAKGTSAIALPLSQQDPRGVFPDGWVAVRRSQEPTPIGRAAEGCAVLEPRAGCRT